MPYMIGIDIKYEEDKELPIPIKYNVVVGQTILNLILYLHGFVKHFIWLYGTLWYYLVE
jgi:hypothetical protein